MPLVILAVACGIAYWTSLKRERQRQDAATAIMQIVQDFCGNSSATLPVDPAAQALEPQLRAELNRACSAGSALNVQAITGDVQNLGSAGGTATHHALIRNGEHVVLILRVHFDGGGSLRILGFVAAPGA
jgi:hypothetical protein